MYSRKSQSRTNRHNILKDRNVTTHWGDIDNLRVCYPDLTVHESIRWIDEGSVVTSTGISAGIDMSLHLVGRLHSMELASKTAKQMEYDWTTDSLECSLQKKVHDRLLDAKEKK